MNACDYRLRLARKIIPQSLFGSPGGSGRRFATPPVVFSFPVWRVVHCAGSSPRPQPSLSFLRGRISVPPPGSLGLLSYAVLS